MEFTFSLEFNFSIQHFQYFQTYAGAISEPPLAAPGSNLPEASAAADQKSVLLLRRSAAIGDVRFRTVCIKGRNRLPRNGLL